MNAAPKQTETFVDLLPTKRKTWPYRAPAPQIGKHYQLTSWVSLSQPDRWTSHCNNESIDINSTITRVQLCFLTAFNNDFSKSFPGFCFVLDGAAEPLRIHQSSISVGDRSAAAVFLQDWLDQDRFIQPGMETKVGKSRQHQHTITYGRLETLSCWRTSEVYYWRCADVSSPREDRCSDRTIASLQPTHIYINLKINKADNFLTLTESLCTGCS